ncbi:hypothetical protein L596_012849 [Steinernema carpocapsae]|uniref:Uncharacterized protein n=1 Tax=Steinernema carpocapsae TaxID=34508 RepID=A0A4U5NYY1_STECR|nr:hypothetical protein L596_012849 [Steinernema carpocapsae]
MTIDKIILLPHHPTIIKHQKPTTSYGIRLWFLLSVIITVAVIIVYQTACLNYQDQQQCALLEQVVVNKSSNGCQVPAINPWDETIREYIKNSNPINCRKLQEEITYLSADGFIYFNSSEMVKTGYDQKSLKCSYRCFDKQLGNDVNLIHGEWKALRNGTFQPCEFVEVDCQKPFPPLSIYSNLHAKIIPNKTFAEKIPKSKKPNVILFVLDSVSEANWRRALPKTLKVLQEEYKSTVFKGFNKVGDNSFPNAVAFLTVKE